MKIRWNDPNTARWFEDASRYTGYNGKMAGILLARIRTRGSLCDMGCGLAMADIEMAPHFRQVTCIDLSGDAIRDARASAEKLGRDNMEFICADGSSVSGQWDAVISLFHGKTEDNFKYFSENAGSEFHAVTWEEGMHRNIMHAEPDVLMEMIRAAGFECSAEHMSLEYGQPFRSYEDAVAFVRAYGKNEEGQTEDEYLVDRLQRIDGEFSYYLPQLRRFVVIDAYK